jgi:hypothetical protein
VTGPRIFSRVVAPLGNDEVSGQIIKLSRASASVDLAEQVNAITGIR